MDGTDQLRRTVLAPWLAATAFLLLAGLGAFFLPPIVRHRAFRAERDQMQALLDGIRQPPPAGVSPDKWEHVWMVVYNGFGNVCFTQREVSVAEMRRLHTDLEAELNAQPISLETLERIWVRLGETGAHGAEYTQRLRPLLDEAIAY